MAAKFDGKRAGENFWVMQQNLAKQKGGRQPRWFQQPRPKKVVETATTVATPSTAGSADAVPSKT